MENLFEKQLSSENVFKGVLLDVYCDDIELPNGRNAKREYIKHVGAACVVPVDNDGNIIIEKQFRYPFHKVLTEIPAGKLDHKGEDTQDAGIRELREETGLVADSVEYLGTFFATPGFCDEKLAIYLSTGLHQKDADPDDDEFVECEKYHIDELVEKICRGEIKDAKSVNGILMTKNKLD